MNRDGALLAVDRLMRGEPANVYALADWLVTDVVPDRYEPTDVVDTVTNVALAGASQGQASAAVLDELIAQLVEAPTLLVFGVFRGAALSTEIDLDPVWLGPATLIDQRFSLSSGADESFAATLKSDHFLVLVRTNRNGRMAAALGLSLLRGAIGALYIVAVNAGVEPAIAELPAQSPSAAVMIGPGADGRYSEHVVGRRIGPAAVVDLDELLRDAQARDILEDCVAPRSEDLVSQRLSQCTPWLQIGMDALADSDAFLALGIALEALVGSEGGGETVDVVARRTGYLMRQGDTDEERALSGLSWANRTRKFYGERSTVAHARYVHDPTKAGRERQIRSDFEALVCALVPRFRSVGRAKAWTDYRDMKSWWDIVQMA